MINILICDEIPLKVLKLHLLWSSVVAITCAIKFPPIAWKVSEIHAVAFFLCTVTHVHFLLHRKQTVQVIKWRSCTLTYTFDIRKYLTIARKCEAQPQNANSINFSLLKCTYCCAYSVDMFPSFFHSQMYTESDLVYFLKHVKL